MWSAQGPRNLGAGVHRGGGTPISAQQNQQDDLFASRLSSAQGSFRFGNQGSASQAAQGQSGGAEEFPPLNRTGNGEIGGQERGASLMSSLGFGAQGSTSGPAMTANRAGNGLLSALSATSRATDVRSPTAIARPQDPRSPASEDEPIQKPAPYREGSVDSVGGRNPLGAIGNEAPTAGKGKEEEKTPASQVQDPLEGMAPIDKWGLKGLRTLMNNFPDYNALTCGLDPATLGVDMRSTEYVFALQTGQLNSLANSVQHVVDKGLLAIRRCAAAVARTKVPAPRLLPGQERAADRGQDLQLQRGDVDVDILQLPARHEAADGGHGAQQPQLEVAQEDADVVDQGRRDGPAVSRPDPRARLLRGLGHGQLAQREGMCRLAPTQRRIVLLLTLPKAGIDAALCGSRHHSQRPVAEHRGLSSPWS